MKNQYQPSPDVSKGGHLISLKFDQIGFGSKFDAPATFAQSAQSVIYQVLFSREAAVQESLMAPFLGQKCPNHVVFEGL